MTEYYRMLQDTPQCCRVLQGTTEYYTMPPRVVLQGNTGYRILQGTTGYYTMPPTDDIVYDGTHNQGVRGAQWDI